MSQEPQRPATGPSGGAQGPPQASPPARIPRHVLVLVGVTTLGVVMSTLDTTIVTVGVDAMGRDLHEPVSVVQWVSTSYLLSFSMVIPLTGWAISRFGARATWLTALGVFTVGSLLCGLSWSVGALIAFRALQGLGGGMLLPLSQTVVARAAGPALVARVMGIAAVPGMLSPAFGPVIGGLIVDHLSWSWLFYVNVPIGVAALVLAWRTMPGDRAAERPRLDAVSLTLLSPALALLAFGFSQAGGDAGFGAPSVAPSLAGGAVLLACFVVYALRRRAAPLVDLRLFAGRAFAASAACSLLLGASLFGALILFPLYYQQVRGQDAMTAGLLLARQGLGAVLVTPWAGRLTQRLGAGRVVPAGLVLALLGTLPYAFVGARTSEPLLAAALLVRGAGLGATFMPTIVAAYHGLRKESVADATSLVNIVQRVGGSIGTAVLTTLLQRGVEDRAHGSAALSALRPGQHTAWLVPAFDRAFLWAFAFTAVALLPALLLPAGAGRPGPAPEPAGTPPQAERAGA